MRFHLFGRTEDTLRPEWEQQELSSVCGNQDSLKIEAVIDRMQMDDDGLLQLLGYLMSCEMLDINEGIVAIHQAKLQQMIAMQKRYIAER